MDAIDALLLAHAFSTVFMAGLVWVIQLVHYPLFLAIVPPDPAPDDEARFVRYASSHAHRITFIVAPMMLIEGTTALAILIAALTIAGDLSTPLAIAGGVLLMVNWLSTALVQGPIHVALAKSYDRRRIERLISSNWIRTAAWTARAIVALLMLPMV